MARYLKTFLLALLTPGLGYLQSGNKKSFYKTIILFFSILVTGAAFRLLTSFWGLLVVLFSLAAIYIFTAIHAVVKVKSRNPKLKNAIFLKLCFTISFLLTTALLFANRRFVMGFDIMNMSVPVMQPTVFNNERFLVDTWAYKRTLPKAGDIAAHSFNGQQGLFLNRIIAVENDKIEIKNGIVLLNGQVVNEPYVSSVNVINPKSLYMKALIVPRAHYFVMGDNRDASLGDSRFSGPITLANIVGKATDIISSQDKRRIGRTLK